MSDSKSAEVMVKMQDVDIVFGKNPSLALSLIDQGASRATIAEETGQIVGVKRANLDILEGETVVLMGLSGSGKSTLLRAVNGLNTVSRGRIVVRQDGDEIDVSSCSQARLRAIRRHQVAMVFQQFALLPWRTVRNNVALGLEVSGMAPEMKKERVDRQLALVGLADWSEKQVHELSGGMQQRVGLARAFATDAPILLMDEPYSALDPLIRDRLQDELIALRQKLNRTIIFVSHDLDEALKIGSRIAIMEGGDIVQVGTPQEIVLNPASQYVQDFVAHMNPLNVLRASEIMTVMDKLEHKSDDQGSGKTIPIEQISGADPDAVISILPKTPVRALIDARLQHPGPFVVKEDHREIGVVRDQELFKCLARNSKSVET